MPLLFRVTTAAFAMVVALTSVSHAQDAPSMAYTGPSQGESAQLVRDTLLSFARARGLGLRDLADPGATAPRDERPELDKAIADYVAFRYAEAIARLDKLGARLADSGAGGFSRRELADVYIYRAMSKTEVGSTSAARDDLIRAATLFPSYQLDEARFRPSLRAAFERARSSVKASAGAEITFQLEAGCIIHVDGERVSETAIKLRAGQHYLRVRCADFEPLSTTVTFAAGAQDFKPTLVPLPDPRLKALEASTKKLIWVNASRATPGRVDIELIDVATKKAKRQWTLTITDRASASTLEDVLTSLIDTEFAAPAPPPIVITKERPRAWYQREWIWVAAGVVAASAVILPFALRDNQASGFGASLEGLP